MQYLRLIRQSEVDSQLYVFTLRWLLAIFAVLFGIYLGFDRVRSVEAAQQLSGNAWDMVFSVLNNTFFVLIPFGILFPYLVSSVSVSDEFAKHVMMRLETRKQWWYGKVSVIAYAAFLFTSLFVGGVVFASTALNWSPDWSEIAHLHPEMVNLTSWMISLSPLQVLASSFVLLFLGCFTVGLLPQVIVVLTGKPFYGFLGSMSLILAAVIVNNLGLTPSWPAIFVHSHWVLGNHIDPVSVAASVIYWLIGISLLVIFGLWGSRKLDFL
jgi:hypothetical protein